MTTHDMDPDRANAMQAEAMTDERRAELRKPVEDWVELEGKTIKPLDGDPYVFDADQEGRQNERVGTYAGNNGKLVAIDGDGHHWVTAQSPGRVEALKQAGYEFDGGLSVPISNGERFADTASNSRLLRQEQEAYAEHRQGLDQIYRTAAEKAGISPDVAGEWLAIDGMDIKQLDGETYSRGSRYDSGMSQKRLAEVGTYSTNNGILARVDHEGIMQVAPATSERVSELHKAGYRPESLSVPLSNGDKPANDYDLEKWDRMVQEALDDRRDAA